MMLTDDEPAGSLSYRIAALVGEDPYRWNHTAAFGTATVITYSFSDVLPADLEGQYGNAGFRAFSEAERDYARQALASWSAVAGLQFVEVPQAVGGMIRWHFLNFNDVGMGSYSGFAYYPNRSTYGISPIAGDVFLDLTENSSYAPGDWGFATMVHEVGHALGLKHPFEGTPTLPSDEDTKDNTIMSYSWTATTPRGPQPYDVDAIRYLYGTSMAAGGVTFSWDATTYRLTATGDAQNNTVNGTDLTDILRGGGGTDRLFGWDGDDILYGDGSDTLIGGPGADLFMAYGGGSTFWARSEETRYTTDPGDTLDYSQASGAISVTFGDLGTTPYQVQVAGVSGTDQIASRFAVLRGSAGDDTFTGGTNYLYVDRIEGGAGNDTFTHGSLDFTFDGGSGFDTLNLDYAMSWLTVVRSPGSIRLQSSYSDTYFGTISGIERVVLRDAVLSFVPQPRDLNGDGRGDLLWRDRTGSRLYAWNMNASTVEAGSLLGTADPDWRIIGRGDLDGDGDNDILWQNRRSGQVTGWQMTGTSRTGGLDFGTAAGGYRAFTGDFNGDGIIDILWNDGISGATYLWQTGGPNGLVARQAPEWAVMGAADMSGDGKADILWRNRTTGEAVLWTMDGATRTGSPSGGTVGRGTRAILADFNADGITDILWHDPASRRSDLWTMGSGGVRTAIHTIGGTDAGWTLAGAVDTNGDAKADLVWRNAVSGRTYVWTMDGAARVGGGSLPSLDASWALVGDDDARATGEDMTGDGLADIVWRNGATGATYLWRPGAFGSMTATNLGGPDSRWKLLGSADVDGDGKADLLWHDSTGGAVRVWLMDGDRIRAGAHLGTATPGLSATVADLTGDGKADIVWRNGTTGATYLWRLNGTAAASSTLIGAVDSGWTIADAGDVDGDGMADLLWRNASRGAASLWLMNGDQRRTGVSLGNLDAAWRGSLADMTGDGRADILWRNAQAGTTYLWAMDGTTRVGATRLADTGSQWEIAGTGDYTGDGKADLLWRNGTTGSVGLWAMDNGVRIGSTSLANVGSAYDTVRTLA